MRLRRRVFTSDGRPLPPGPGGSTGLPPHPGDRSPGEPGPGGRLGAEFLDLILAVKVVPDLPAALSHIAQYSSNHTEAIITRDYARAQRFLTEVDSSVVLSTPPPASMTGVNSELGAEIASTPPNCTPSAHGAGRADHHQVYRSMATGKSEPEPPLRLGLFGGTFNPMHYGHLRSAEEVCAALALTRLWFIPAGQPAP